MRLVLLTACLAVAASAVAAAGGGRPQVPSNEEVSRIVTIIIDFLACAASYAVCTCLLVLWLSCLVMSDSVTLGSCRPLLPAGLAPCSSTNL